MKLAERLARDRETLKRLEGKQRGRFLWDYYRIPIVVLAAVLVLGALVIATSVGHAKCALYAVFVNANRPDEGLDPAALETLLAQGGVDMKGRRVDLTADLTLSQEMDAGESGQTVQVLAALFGISGLDFFAADPDSFDRYAAQGAFADLSLLLEPELWEDRPEADLLWHTDGDGRRTLQGVVLHPGSPLHAAGYFRGDVAVGAAVNAENLDAAVALVRELLRTA